MVHGITNGISGRLSNIYGDDYQIYDTDTKQGFLKPCFFVQLQNVVNTPFIGKRKKREYSYDISFFPADETDNSGMMAVGEQLMEELEYITLKNGDMSRGYNMAYEIKEGVLHFKITYKAMLIDAGKEDSMNDCGLAVGVKG